MLKRPNLFPKPHHTVCVYPESDAAADGTTVCIMNASDFVFIGNAKIPISTVSFRPQSNKTPPFLVSVAKTNVLTTSVTGGTGLEICVFESISLHFLSSTGRRGLGSTHRHRSRYDRVGAVRHALVSYGSQNNFIRNNCDRIMAIVFTFLCRECASCRNIRTIE